MEDVEVPCVSVILNEHNKTKRDVKSLFVRNHCKKINYRQVHLEMSLRKKCPYSKLLQRRPQCIFSL